MKFIIALCVLCLTCTRMLFAGPSSKPATTQAVAKPTGPKPTLANVPFGTHEQQVLDFWKAPSARPTPLVFYIHGGGWYVGDKSEVLKDSVQSDVARYLKAGISVVSINYRFVPQAKGIYPPVKVPMDDAARALQFVRSKAGEWNIDPERIGLSGSSAGAVTGFWLAFHADLADPSSADPIARQSTRVRCIAVRVPQTSLDPAELRQWIPNSIYGAHAFGVPGEQSVAFEKFLADREKYLPEIQKYSPIALVTADAPPVYMIFYDQPALGQKRKDPTHTANSGVKMAEKLRSLGVECEFVYPGAPDVKHRGMQDYLIDKLQTK